MTTTVDKMPIHDSLAELLAEISERGRDSFVAGLAKNRDIYGYTPGPWRKREEKDGIVYLVMCLKDLKVYVGQTNDVDRRLCEHLGGYGCAEGLANAIKKHHRNNFGRAKRWEGRKGRGGKGRARQSRWQTQGKQARTPIEYMKEMNTR